MSVINNNVLAGAAGSGGAAEYTIDNSLRFNPSDSASLTKTFSSDSSTWTLSFWMKRSQSGYQMIFGSYGGGASYIELTSEQLRMYLYRGTTTSVDVTSNAVLRDYSAWYHIVYSVTSGGTGYLYINGVLDKSFSCGTVNYLFPSGYQSNISGYGTQNAYYYGGNLADIYFIEQALDATDFGEFDDNNVWQPIAYSGSYGTNGFHLDFSDNSSASALGTDASPNGNNWTVNNINVGVTSVTTPQWYASQTLYTTKADILANATAKGTGSWTASNEFAYLVINDGGRPGVDNVWSSNFPLTTYVYRNKGGTYVNSGGFNTAEGTNFDWGNSPSTYTIDNNQDFYLLADTRVNGLPDAAGYFSGSVSALVTSSFKTLSERNAEDDSLRDSPTNGDPTLDTGLGGELPGNYCTWNPLDTGNMTQLFGTLSQGNLKFTSNSGTSNYSGHLSTIGLRSGKWYCEFNINAVTLQIGIVKETAKFSLNSGTYGFATGADARMRANNGFIYYSSTSQQSGLATFNGGEVLMIAVDFDAGKMWTGLDGTWDSSGDPAAGTNPTTTFTTGDSDWLFAIQGISSGGADANWGQRPFAHAAPTDFKSVCTANLPTPDIEDGSTAMDVVTWTGDGNSTRNITGLNFQPELVWLKSRSVSNDHNLFDSVRGAQNTISSNLTAAEVNQPIHGYVTAFNSDGFAVAGGSLGDVNYSNRTYVAWTWDGGTAFSNSAGTNGATIASSGVANQDAGFSIVTGEYFAGSLGHGLGVAPAMVIAKQRSAANSWYVYHKDAIASGTVANNSYLALESTSAVGNFGSNLWNISSTTIGNSVGTSGGAVYYCWAPVEGYSAFGSYVGNFSTDGPFIYTGFRPRFILTKASSAGSDWQIIDSTRSDYNLADDKLWASQNYEENSATLGGAGADNRDILSNGFKLRNANNGTNGSGVTYIYAAFAENPFKYARAR